MELKKEQINRWISDYSKPYESLLPQNLSDSILNLILDEVNVESNDDGKKVLLNSELLAYVVLILSSHVNGVVSFSINEKDLVTNISCYAHCLHLESMQRNKKLTYSPKFCLDSILTKENYQLQFTDSGSEEFYHSNDAINLN